MNSLGGPSRRWRLGRRRAENPDGAQQCRCRQAPLRLRPPEVEEPFPDGRERRRRDGDGKQELGLRAMSLRQPQGAHRESPDQGGEERQHDEPMVRGSLQEGLVRVAGMVVDWRLHA